MKISLLRHKNLSEIEQCKHRLNKDGDCLPKNILYHQHVSYADQFFSILMNTDPKTSPTLANIMFCQFLESALLNILVIDERISQILCRAVSPDEPGISLIDKLYWMGIYVASGFKNNGDTLFNYIPECTSQENKTFFKEIEFNNFTDGKKDSFKFEDELPIHILLIHATRFNEIYTKYCELQKGEFTKEKFIDDVLKKKFPHVVVHSGRGKTKGDIPGNVSFVEYSLVQKYLIQEPSKFFLTQIALNAKAGN
jgi:thioredoxin-related protein